MRLIVRPSFNPRKLGILAGSFNPPTQAHLAIAEAALRRVDAVMLVLPGSLPHKTWEGATPQQRADMLTRVVTDKPHLCAAIADGGLYVEIVREARGLFPESELYVVCGRDAAERIVEWDYGEPDAIVRHLEEFKLLVAPRGGCYEAPPHVAHAVEALPLGDFDEFASTRVRERCEGWRDLVPDEIADMVDRIY